VASQVAYVYVPELSRDQVREVLAALSQCGFRISHPGKRDPPKKRVVSYEEAAELITNSRLGGANTTFVDDRESGIGLTFEVREGPRYGFSTISLSLQERIPAHELCCALFQRLKAFACVSGFEGAGKNQSWGTCLIAEQCPEKLRSRLSSLRDD
jgi:hypothetical protein